MNDHKRCAESSAQLAVIGRPAATPCVGAVFASWHAFSASSLEPVAFLLSGLSAAELDQTVKDIRASRHWDRYVLAEGETGDHPLLDGEATAEMALRLGRRAEERKASLAMDPAALGQDERLLLYLYLREKGALRPVLDRRARLLYRYPLAELIGHAEADDTPDWLNGLVRRQLLEAGEMADRTRHCRRCASAHLHFRDVCPHCSSLHILRTPSLHCFTCGHVAPQQDFSAEGGLVCPRCRAQLRHIGVDYDRTLTQYACAACHHAFVDARVVAGCLDCGAQADPGELDVRQVSTLHLSARGRAALRAGQIHESFAALDSANYTVPDFFTYLVNWGLSTHTRHHEFVFCLVLLEFLNAVELVEAHGAPRAFAMMDEFARRLRELLRSSDVTTRTTEERLWIFMPYSDAKGFLGRLERSVSEMQPQRSPGILLRSRVLHVPKDVGAAESALTIMERLEAESALHA